MNQTLERWTQWFNAIGVAWKTVESNQKALSLVGLTGSPLFRVVDSLSEANELHAKARQKSEEMQRLLVIALPFEHPFAMATLPGEIVMPKFRVYSGHIASKFNLAGHKTESVFLTEVKKEVLNVMSNGIKAKTPLCDWLVKLAGSSWCFGTPASLPQLDSLLGLICRDTALLGHVRTRQLSFGRGCCDALLLPIDGVVLKNNSVNQRVEASDLRFIGLENEMAMRSPARDRIHAMFSDKYLTVLNDSEMGTAAQIGPSRLGTLKVSAEKVLSQRVEPKAEGCFTIGEPLSVGS